MPTDHATYRRALTWAVLASVAVAFYVYRLVRKMVVLQSDGMGPLATITFLMLSAVLIGAWFGLRHLWRRALRARPQQVAPEPEEPSGRHLTLDGSEPPPTRW